MLVTKQHYLDADKIPDELLAHLMIMSKKIVTVLKEIYHPNGYSIMQKDGEFNDVGHYHLHIFIAIVHRNDDVEEKWIVAPEGVSFTKEEIREQIHFQEQEHLLRREKFIGPH